MAVKAGRRQSKAKQNEQAEGLGSTFKALHSTRSITIETLSLGLLVLLSTLHTQECLKQCRLPCDTLALPKHLVHPGASGRRPLGGDRGENSTLVHL